MKKLIALMLALLMLVGMVACGAKEPAEEPAEKREHVTLRFVSRVNEQPVEAEVTNCTTAFVEYKILLSGSVDVDEYLPAFLAKLEAAGVDTLIAEMQAQVDAFLGK